MLNKTLINKLKKHERSQRWLSRKLNISAMAVCKWCNGMVKIPKKRYNEIERWLP